MYIIINKILKPILYVFVIAIRCFILVFYKIAAYILFYLSSFINKYLALAILFSGAIFISGIVVGVNEDSILMLIFYIIIGALPLGFTLFYAKFSQKLKLTFNQFKNLEVLLDDYAEVKYIIDCLNDKLSTSNNK